MLQHSWEGRGHSDVGRAETERLAERSARDARASLRCGILRVYLVIRGCHSRTPFSPRPPAPQREACRGMGGVEALAFSCFPLWGLNSGVLVSWDSNYPS